MDTKIDRRGFLRLGAAAGLAAKVGQAALGEDKQKPVRLAVIGVGGRGTHLLRLALAAGVEVPALCDIKDAHLNRAVNLVAKARTGRKPVG